MLKVSIIMPVLNEAENIEAILKTLQSFREQGNEVIVVDGGSVDETVKIANNLADVVVQSQKGRAIQMNAGAEVAQGDTLLFLHADTVLPEEACEIIQSSISDEKQWGRFDVRLSSNKAVFRVIEFFINKRSAISSIATGDQAIFITKQSFEVINGFPKIALMEDIAISKRLKKISKSICLTAKVKTSSRRWEERGVINTVLLMWRLRFLYFMGVSPEYLVSRYYK